MYPRDSTLVTLTLGVTVVVGLPVFDMYLSVSTGVISVEFRISSISCGGFVERERRGAPVCE